MEIVWLRVFSPIFGGSIYTTGVVLTTILFGLGLGGLLYSRRFGEASPNFHEFSIFCAWEAVFLAFPFFLGDRVAILAMYFDLLKAGGLVGRVFGWCMISGIVILPAATIAGYQFPMLAGLAGTGRKRVGDHYGRLFAWNTLGSMLGAILGGFLFLPVLTAERCWILSVLLLLTLALAGIRLPLRLDKAYRSSLPTVLLSLLACVFVLGEGPTAAWRHSPIGAGRMDVHGRPFNAILEQMARARRSMVWQQEGRESSLAIDDSEGLGLMVNGDCDGNLVSDVGTQVMLGFISAILHPKPENAFVVGLGTGCSAGWLAAIPTMEKVVVAELEPGTLEMARRSSAANRNPLNNPKVQLRFGDAREILQTSSETFDLIVSEPSNPYRSGVAGLYSQEFFQIASDRLSPGGLFSQWFPVYDVEDETLSSLYGTACSVFPFVETWQMQSGDYVLICGKEKTGYPVAALRDRIRQEPFASALKCAWKADDLEGFLARYVANAEFAKILASSCMELGLLNTDDRPVLEFHFAKACMGSGRINLSLRHSARQLGLHLPKNMESPISSEQILENYYGIYTIRGSEIDERFLSGERKLREKAHTIYLSESFPEILPVFGRIEGMTPTTLEEVMICEARAELGNETGAMQLIESLEKKGWSEVHPLKARLFLRLEKPEKAFESIEDSILEFRRSPWILPSLMGRSLDLCVELSLKYPAFAQQVCDLLNEPFCVSALQYRRQRTRLSILAALNSPELLEAIARFEPHVPWDEDFLKTRFFAYQKAGHRLKGQAYTDLISFYRNSSPYKAKIMAGIIQSAL